MIGTVQWTTYGQGEITMLADRPGLHPLVAVRLHGPVSFKTRDGSGFTVNWPGTVEIWAELMGPICDASHLATPSAGAAPCAPARTPERVPKR